MLYGARYSLAIGICSQLLAVIIGVILGSLAGYFGGAVDNVILRFTDIFQSIPSTLLAIVISQALGSGFVQTMIALAVGGVTGCDSNAACDYADVRGPGICRGGGGDRLR